MLPSSIKKTIFCILASKPLHLQYVDNLLSLMKPLMMDVEDLVEVGVKTVVDNYKTRIPTTQFKLLPSTYISNDPVSYLLR